MADHPETKGTDVLDEERAAWERVLAEAQAIRAQLIETNGRLDEMHKLFMAIENSD